MRLLSRFQLHELCNVLQTCGHSSENTGCSNFHEKVGDFVDLSLWRWHWFHSSILLILSYSWAKMFCWKAPEKTPKYIGTKIAYNLEGSRVLNSRSATITIVVVRLTAQKATQCNMTSQLRIVSLSPYSSWCCQTLVIISAQSLVLRKELKGPLSTFRQTLSRTQSPWTQSLLTGATVKLRLVGVIWVEKGVLIELRWVEVCRGVIY